MMFSVGVLQRVNTVVSDSFTRRFTRGIAYRCHGMPGDERESPSVHSLTAEDAFALIGDETRAEVLRVLGQEAHLVFSFSGLRSRVDPGIDSSQFNYHLQQLVGHFVEQTNDGYQVRPRRRTFYRMIRAGTLTRYESFDHLDVGFDCYFCETPVEAAYDDGLFTSSTPAANVFTPSLILRRIQSIPTTSKRCSRGSTSIVVTPCSRLPMGSVRSVRTLSTLTSAL